MTMLPQIFRARSATYRALGLSILLAFMPAASVRSQPTYSIDPETLDRILKEPPSPHSETDPVCSAVGEFYLKQIEFAREVSQRDEAQYNIYQERAQAHHTLQREIKNLEQRLHRAQQDLQAIGQSNDIQARIAEIQALLEQRQQQQAALNFDENEYRAQQGRTEDSDTLLKYRSLNNLNRTGVLAYDAGDFDKALRYFESIIKQSEKLGISDAKQTGKANSAMVHETRADYATALAVLQDVLQSAQRADPQSGNVARILLDIARVYDKLGSYVQADRHYQQSLALSTQRRRVANRAAALSSLGFLYNNQENYGKALESFTKAKSEIETVRLDGQAILHEEHMILNGMGRAQTALGNYSAALASYERALALSQSCNNEITGAMALNGLGEVYQALAQPDQAIASYQKSLQVRRSIGDVAGEAETLANLGGWYVEQSKPLLGIVLYKRAVERLEDIRTKIEVLTLEQQTAYATSVVETYRELANLLLQQDRILEAQQVLDLLKVQELHEFLKDVDQEIQGDRTSERLTFWAEERDILSVFEQALFQEDLSQFENHSVVKASLDNLTSNAKLQKINTELLSSLQDNIRRLSPNSAILYPLVLADRVEVIFIPSEGEPSRSSTPIVQKELEKLIADFHKSLRNSASENPDELGQKLYQILIYPLEDALQRHDVQTIIYASDSQLRYIPLAALFDGQKWLVERFKINNITAASLTDFSVSSSRTRLSSTLAAAFSAQLDTPYQFEVGNKVFEFNGLKESEGEINAVAGISETATVLLNQDFDREAVEENLESHNLLHFATHAAFVDGAPDESFILLGNGDRINLHDISEWNLTNIALIVLSACETAVSSEFGSGKEILGFGYQIQRAGARRGISTLWNVNDGKTQRLMNFFYKYLQNDDLNYVEALRFAQISLIHNLSLDDNLDQVGRDDLLQSADKSILSHPHYWAPFTLIGNGL